MYKTTAFTPSRLYLHHGLVLLLQLLVHNAVLLHRQQGQGALELAGLALCAPAHQFGQQVGGQPGQLRVDDAIREPLVRSQSVQLQGPGEEGRVVQLSF